MNEENVAIRLKGFMDTLGLSSSQFADQCGIPRPSLSQLLSGRNKKISDVLVGQIHKAFPRLSVVWLLFGEGKMLTEDLSDEAGNNERNSGETAFAPVSLETDGSVGAGCLNVGDSKFVKNGLDSTGRLEKLLIDREAEIEELRKEIDRLRKTPRKVSQITVYYDDSTFETFYPASIAGRSTR